MLSAQLVYYLHHIGRWAVARVDDGKVEGMHRSPAECELQGEMQGVEVAICQAGERSNHRRILDLAGMEMELDDIIRTLADVLVRGPGGCLAVMGAVGYATASCTSLQGRGRIDGVGR